MLRAAIARRADRLDRTLGRLVFRAVGAVVGLVAVGVGWVAASALSSGHRVAALVFGAVALGAAALTRHCFRRERRLSDLED